MKKGYWTSRIYRTGKYSYLTENMCYPLKKGKNDPKGKSLSSIPYGKANSSDAVGQET